MLKHKPVAIIFFGKLSCKNHVRLFFRVITDFLAIYPFPGYPTKSQILGLHDRLTQFS